MRSVVLVAHNVRSCHNVGSLLRTADGLGVSYVYLTGYTPYPSTPNGRDPRFPHIAAKLHKQIQKTALGAEITQPWKHCESIEEVFAELRTQGFIIAAIEQAANATPLPEFSPPDKLALVVGREVEGIEPEVLAMCDKTLEIPMFGKKESFNVAQAAAMGLYHSTFTAQKA